MAEIRLATESDWPVIWRIFRAVVEKGDTFSYDSNTTEEEARRAWFQPPVVTFVAIEDSAIIGTYMLKPNQPGRGSHIANAGFMVAPGYRGKGIGRTMGEHALRTAKELSFEAMQFNFVVGTNERAVALWQSLGFAIIGTVPKAFHHRQKGLVDVYIMHRPLP